jgi:hypothetical protein
MPEFTFEQLYDEIDVLVEEDGYVQLPSLEHVETMTDAAVYIKLEGYSDHIWIPKSVLSVDTDETLFVKEWFYRKEL